MALNGGTTTSEVARALATRPDLQDGTGAQAVTVVTNAMNIASELAVRQHIKIVVTGGVTRAESYELIGPFASLVLAQLTLDWAILGVDAPDPRTGATAHHEGEASINYLMATRADQVMIVTDSSKLGQRAFARVCAADEIDVIVTDREPARPARRVHRTRHPRRHRLPRAAPPPRPTPSPVTSSRPSPGFTAPRHRRTAHAQLTDLYCSIGHQSIKKMHRD